MVAKQWERNAHGKGGREVWPTWVHAMLMELLSLRLPPKSIAPAIAAVKAGLHPNKEVKGSRVSDSVLRESRGVLAVVTKTLATYQLAMMPKLLQHHSNGTDVQHVGVENAIVCIPKSKEGHKCVCLSSAIIPEGKSATSGVTAISQAFREGRTLLEEWEKETQCMYPNCPDLMQLVPDAKELEGQTQCLQKEVAMNRKVIDEQSKELTEKGQQLITARLEKEEKAMVARK